MFLNLPQKKNSGYATDDVHMCNVVHVVPEHTHYEHRNT
jgi:hypothetical protein